MAIDPMIANPTALKLNDPLEQYNNYLVAANNQGTMRKAKREEERQNALNNAMRGWDPRKSRQENMNALVTNLAGSGLGTEIFGALENDVKLGKYESEIGENNAQAGKFKNEADHEVLKGKKTVAETLKVGAETSEVEEKAFEKAWANSTAQLGSINTANPEEAFKQYGVWLSGQFKNPLIKKGLESRNRTLDGMVAELISHKNAGTLNELIKRTVMGLDKATEQESINLDLGGTRKVITRDKHTLGNVPDRDFKVTEAPGDKYKGVKVYNTTNMAMHAAGEGMDEMSKTVLRHQGEEYNKLDGIVRAAPRDIADLDRSLAILNSGNVITGGLAEQKAAALSLAKAFNIRVNDEMLKNTQLLRVQIANSVLQSIAHYKSQGVSLTPMSDNDAKRLEAAGPNIQQDPESLKILLGIKREMITNAIERHKELDTALRTRTLSRPTMDLQVPAKTPKVPPAPGQWPKPTQANIDRLKKNPGEKAIFEKHYGPGSAKRYAGVN